MRRFKRILIVIAAFAAMTIAWSCIDNRYVFLRSYVADYYEFKGIRLPVSNGSSSTMYVRGGTAGFDRYNISFVGGHDSTGGEKKAYDELCEHFGDMNYNETIEKVPYIPFVHFRRFFANEFTSIEVFSDADYDEQHPAKASLADIVRFMSLSPMPYIESGYSFNYDWDNPVVSEQFYNAIYKKYIAIN